MTDDLEPLDPELRSYLRSRADLVVPTELATRAFERVRRSGPPSPIGFGRWAAVAGIAAVLVIAAISFTLGSRPQVRPTFSPGHSPAAVAPTDQPASAEPSVASSPEIGSDDFPTDVLGMPVVSLADARALLNEGRLDGRAVAVKGYWIQVMVPSCPAPGRYMAPLEQYCYRPLFSSVGYAGGTCIELGDGGSECHSNAPPPGAATLSPVMLSDTGAQDVLWSQDLYKQYPEGYPAVLIGHADDPRSWQCPVDTRDQCRDEFVVDRIAWFAGQSVDLAVPPGEIQPSSLLEDIASSIGTETLLTAWSGVAWNAPEVDPRFHSAWSEIVWIARSVGDGSNRGDPTRPVDVWLINDDGASILESLPLAAPPDYRPGIFRAQAVINSATDDGGAYFVVDTTEGFHVDVGVGAWQMFDGSNRRLLPGLAAVLDPGTYVVRASQKNLHIPSTKHPDECTTEFELGPLEELRLEAAFPETGRCEWREPTFEDSRY